MSLEKRVRERLETAIREHVFPGCAVAYVRGGHVTAHGFGRLTYAETSPLVTAETVYDVASLTKPIPTGSLVHHLVEAGRLSYDDKVIDYVPEIHNQYREQILVRHLLTYTVVLDIQAGLATSARAGVDELRRVLFASPLKAPPGELYHYTNTPAIWLGLLVERVYGQPLDEIAQSEFFSPLGMARTSFNGEQFAPEEVAPTEIDWRGEMHRTVHDETAWCLQQAGDMPGNAGLFSTAPDLLVFARMLLAGGAWQGRRYFEPQTVELMHTNQLAYLGESSGLGWEMGQEWFMGEAAKRPAFAKTGFTGSVIVIDPEREAALVFLTNRTYPHRPESRTQVHAVRRDLADMLLDLHS